MSKDEVFQMILVIMSGLIIPVLIKKIQNRENRISEDKWKPKKLEKDGNFYILILACSASMTLLVHIICMALCQYSKIIGIFFVVFCDIIIILLFNRRKFVRKRLLANSKRKMWLVIDATIIVMQIFWEVYIRSYFINDRYNYSSYFGICRIRNVSWIYKI